VKATKATRGTLAITWYNFSASLPLPYLKRHALLCDQRPGLSTVANMPIVARSVISDALIDQLQCDNESE